MTDVWAYSESPHAAAEALSAADDVAGGLSAKAVLVALGGPAPGAGLLIRASPPPTCPEEAAEAIFRAAKAAQPAVILVAATRDGREVASRLSVKLGRGCLSDVAKLKADGRALSGERNEYAGKSQTRVSAELPCIALVKSGAYPAAALASVAAAEVDVGAVARKGAAVSSRKKEAVSVDLRAAKIIVSAGRGVKKKEDLAIVEALAKALGGTIGCSRPLSSDLGWLPEEYHIGLTGVNVKPDLYVAVGISGQLQHVAGMKDSRVVAAVNTDKDAPMFQAADYGIVGDLYQVVPALVKALSAGR